MSPNDSLSTTFPAASRANDYLEDDTAAPISQTNGTPPAPVPAAPSTPAPRNAQPNAKTAQQAKLGSPEPDLGKATAPQDAHTSTAPILDRPRDESLSVLFGGSSSGLAASSAAPTRSRKALRGLLRMAPTAAELQEHERGVRVLANETIIRQATWTRHVRILLANKKGGTGKTPLSILLGGVIAAIRGGSVAIWEVSDDPGALNFRAEGNPTLGLGELVRDVDTITSAGALAGYTVPQTSFASVIGTVGSRAALTSADVVKVSEKIGEFYGIEVMDSGNVPTSPAFQGAVSVADILVIPVMNSGDSVLQAIEVLEELRNGSEHARALAANAIAVRLKDGRPESPAVDEEVARLLHDAGVAQLHEVPYDAHIAERGQLTVGKLTPATRDALAAAAAGVVRSLQTLVSTKR